MKQYIEIRCRHCGADDLVKNGRSENGTQRYRCNQRWTWYAVERKSGVILAYHNGRRTNEICRYLLDKLSAFPITRYHTDDWHSYQLRIPPEAIGKSDIWKIERRNLNFRANLKHLNQKTICFSTDERVYGNVIGMYINRYYFEKDRYSDIT